MYNVMITRHNTNHLVLIAMVKFISDDISFINSNANVLRILTKTGLRLVYEDGSITEYIKAK